MNGGRWYGLLLPSLLSAGIQSAVDPAGPQAGRINSLWWFLFTVCLIVFLLVIGFLFCSIARSRLAANEPTPAPFDPGPERPVINVVAGATAVTVLILFAFLIASVSTGKALSSFRTEDALQIELSGHQWWWEVHYPNPSADQAVVTANEIHIPVGRRIMLKMTSGDVIHSFWAPNLDGKKDLIPDHTNASFFQADTPGTYRGQCAEFCGLQHAHMALFIVAEPPDEFNKWLLQQRTSAAQPSDPVQQRGQQVFLASPCVLCHTVRGTGAFGQVAPDLTHLASRKTIAAGTLPNNAGALAGWITDSQNIKPGNRMPPINIDPADMQPLLSYLESLK
jgi:cytochrome c oxidase subunit 2